MDILRIAPPAAAGLIGTLYGRDVWTLGLSALIPILVFTRPCRGEAAATILLYYAATSWPTVPCARSFWSLSGPAFTPALIWLAATLLLSLPWIVLWSSTRSQIHWRAPLSMLIGAIPPFGLIGWASPLTAAGVLFPGTAWLGVVAVGLIASLPVKAIAVAAIAANLIYLPPPRPPGRTAINTTINTAARVDPVADFEAVTLIQDAATGMKNPFLLAPESAVIRWNEGTVDLWQPTIDELADRNATLLLGTSVAIPGTTNYQNILLAIGKDRGTFVQRNPVPFAMWKPFGGQDNTALRFTGPATFQIADHRAAVLICYEQLLVWQILQSALDHPTLILGVANDYWCRGTRIAVAQQACMKAWARLFSLPMLTATNYGG